MIELDKHRTTEISKGFRPGMTIIGCAAVVLILGCAPTKQIQSSAPPVSSPSSQPTASAEPAPRTEPSQNTPSQTAVPPVTASQPAKPNPAEKPSVETAQPDANVKAPAPAKAAAPPRAAQVPAPVQPKSTAPVATATAPATNVSENAPPATRSLDLKSLEQRLRETRAIGAFTKLSLKNQVDDLLDDFRAYYQGKLKTQLNALRQRYDLLMMKVLSLLQDNDTALAAAISSSREDIWDILKDPVKFKQI